MGLTLKPVQRDFVEAVEGDDFLTACLSGPRGMGKTTLTGWLVARALTPDDLLYRASTESVLCSGSIEQCRLVYRACINFLEEWGTISNYRLVDSATRVAITRKECRTRLKAIGSNPKTSLGFVGVPWVILDEPAALHETGGTALWDAILTAQGKPGSRLKAILIGTLAPANNGNWWPQLVERGTTGSTYVRLLQADPDQWEELDEAMRVNPLAGDFPEQAAKLAEELEEAKSDTRLRARYMSYRLNIPTRDESETLLAVEDWERVMTRPPASQQDLFARQSGSRNRPVFAYDLGNGRAWSAAVALWPDGRVEALAVAPGIPTLAEQERRDQVPASTYRKLREIGVLRVAEGLRVQPPAQLHAAALEAWGRPVGIVCDHFRVNELRDLVKECPVEPRRTQWSYSAEDIRALRKLSKDGPLTCHGGSAALIAESLAVAKVQNDQSGNVRLVKRGTNNQARDDVAAALILGAGAWQRTFAKKPRPRWRYHGAIEATA